jgi:Mn-containing catalase
MRLDRLQAEIPPPSDPDPNGASIVQELLGGKFGEMSTFMNYTYQSFNFRNRQGARPFYDLVASIAAEEFGHIELVATAINTMLTGAAKGKAGTRWASRGAATTSTRPAEGLRVGRASGGALAADPGRQNPGVQTAHQTR